MAKTKHTAAGSAMTEVVLDLFRLNNRLLTAGDRLIADLGLTSARWQVLGTIVATGRSQPVAWLARDMGASRQNVQRIINDLEKQGLVTYQTNPHHRRAQLVVLTEAGKKAFDDAMRLQAPWMNKLTDGLRVADIEVAHKVITTLRRRLESGGDAGDKA